MAKDKLERNCVSPIFRVSYAQVFQPKSFKEGQEAKYSLVMLFDKDTDLKTRHKNGKLNLKEAVHNAMVEAHGKDKTKWPKNYKSPFRDGDEEKPGQQGYENVIFVSATNKNRPGVVDAKRNVITEEDNTFYSGCYARASLQAYWYDTMGNKGVAFALLNVMKTGDGEPFSGRKSAQDDFADFEDDDASDDEASYESDSDEESDFG